MSPLSKLPLSARSWAPRVAIAVTAAVAILGGLECSPSRPHAPTARASAPLITAEPLPRFGPGPRAHPRWSWPAAAHFDATFDGVQRGAQPIHLVRGRLVKDNRGERTAVDGVVLTIAPDGDSFAIAVELAESDDAYWEARFSPRAGWQLASGSLEESADGEPLVFEREGATVRMEPTYASSEGRPAPGALEDWAYVAALLGSDRPVYDDPPAAPPPDGFQKELETARTTGDGARALAIYRVWQPVGQCSMDTHPAEVARDYAELCYRLGKLGCFLQLQIRIMGDQFDRVASSSYGEAAHDTQAERLVDTGLDVDRFLRGLVLRFAGVSRLGELDAWRLARSIRESARKDAMVPVLAAWASDPDLDEYNQLRAVQVLAFLDAIGEVDEAEVSEVARMWLARRAKARR